MADILQLSLDADKDPVTPNLDAEAGFGPLPLRNLVVDWEIPFDVYVKVKEKGETAPHFVMGCPRGEVFRREWYQKLRRLQIPFVYFSLEDLSRVIQYLHHNLDLALSDGGKTDLEKGLRVYDATNMWALSFFNSEVARTGGHIKLALESLDTMFELIEQDRQLILHLKDIRQHSYRVSNHCLNVCLLGLAFTCYLDWGREDIRAFGLGALVHDIGLIHTPLTILEKEGELTAEEMSKVKRHPQDGFRMMENMLQLRWEALQMVLQHHENGDGSGYPQGLKLPDIHLWARIMRILDSYEAMTADRPWRPAMEPKQALWVMRNDWDKNKIYDQHFLKAFMQFLAEG